MAMQRCRLNLSARAREQLEFLWTRTRAEDGRPEPRDRICHGTDGAPSPPLAHLRDRHRAASVRLGVPLRRSESEPQPGMFSAPDPERRGPRGSVVGGCRAGLIALQFPGIILTDERCRRWATPCTKSGAPPTMGVHQPDQSDFGSVLAEGGFSCGDVEATRSEGHDATLAFGPPPPS